MKKKYKIKIYNKKLKKALGEMNPKTNEILIDIKKHKGDKRELASTIKHEMLHVKYPKMTEKDVYKKSLKTKISPAEQTKLISKMKMKSINQKSGAIKRKFKMGNSSTQPGDFITRMNEEKRSNIKSNNQPLSKLKLSIMGLV